MVNTLRAALAELVACKDLKDEELRFRQRRNVSIERNKEALAEVDALREDYNRRKPLAWDAARAVLATPPVDAVPGEPIDLGPVYIPDDQGPEDVRYVREDRALAAIASARPTPMASRAVVAEPVALWRLIYGAIMQDRRPCTLPEWEAVAKRIADMIDRRSAIAPAAASEPSLEALRKRLIELGYSDTAINAMGDDVAMMQRSIDADPAGRVGVASLVAGEEMVLVPKKFVCGFGDLAHNYSMAAEAPDYYRGVERDAFSSAYRRCGEDLKRLRTMLDDRPSAGEAQS